MHSNKTAGDTKHQIGWCLPPLDQISTVSIFCHSSCPGDDRIELSEGTRPAEHSEVQELGFEQSARLPRGTWRPITSREKALLNAPTLPTCISNTICIIRLPSFSPTEQSWIAQNDANAIRDVIVAPLVAACDFDEPLHVIGLAERPPDMITVTRNQESKKYIGLHVDDWDNHVWALRDKSTNRVCVNVGKADRFFLFLPFRYTEIIRLLHNTIDKDLDTIAREQYLERLFMERYPMVPVIRVRLGPGEAYIAPTENLVHDGSSENQRERDLQFTIRGYISLRHE